MVRVLRLSSLEEQQEDVILFSTPQQQVASAASRQAAKDNAPTIRNLARKLLQKWKEDSTGAAVTASADEQVQRDKNNINIKFNGNIDPERLLFCVDGKQYDAFSEHNLVTDGSHTLKELDSVNSKVVVVVLIRYKLDLQVLRFEKTKFPVWLTTGKTITGEEILQKHYLPRLKVLSRLLHSITYPHLVVGTKDVWAGVCRAPEALAGAGPEEVDVDGDALEDKDEAHGPREGPQEENPDFRTDQQLRYRGRTTKTSDHLDVGKTTAGIGRNVKSPTSVVSTASSPLPQMQSSSSSSRGATSSGSGTAAVLQNQARTASTQQRALIGKKDFYRPIHHDVLTIIPRYQLLWQAFYYTIHIVWFFHNLVTSAWITTFRTSRGRGIGYYEDHLLDVNPDGTVSARGSNSSADRDAGSGGGGSSTQQQNARRARNYYHIDVGQDFQHHRHAPGQNPRGEDLTLIVRQALFGL
ncbi:unnamed protein product [Amoebophrya sp. A120]|nr:unnamed protein product [Amoebophrya sp. A120]|eukprot:GSA120T00022024001.1